MPTNKVYGFKSPMFRGREVCLQVGLCLSVWNVEFGGVGFCILLEGAPHSALTGEPSTAVARWAFYSFIFPVFYGIFSTCQRGLLRGRCRTQFLHLSGGGSFLSDRQAKVLWIVIILKMFVVCTLQFVPQKTVNALKMHSQCT